VLAVVDSGAASSSSWLALVFAWAAAPRSAARNADGGAGAGDGDGAVMGIVKPGSASDHGNVESGNGGDGGGWSTAGGGVDAPAGVITCGRHEATLAAVSAREPPRVAPKGAASVTALRPCWLLCWDGGSQSDQG